MAEAYHAQIAPHSITGRSAAAANIQLAACTPNFLILEASGLGTASTRAAEEADRWEDGHVIPSREPGLGVELDKAVVRAHTPTTAAAASADAGAARRHRRRRSGQGLSSRGPPHGIRLHRCRRGLSRLYPGQPPDGKSGRYTVLLLEAGGKDDSFWFQIPVGFTKTLLQRNLQLDVLQRAGRRWATGRSTARAARYRAARDRSTP